MFTAQDHTFALCAYGEGPYLRECIASLKDQSVASHIILCTSTPNGWIEDAARQADIELFVSGEAPGIAHDWNYALSCADTPLVTIAHQDDVYCAPYAQAMLEAMNDAERPLLFFTNYGELRDGEPVDDNRLLAVKRKLLRPLEDKANRADVRVRRRVLSLGSAICCPSVTMAVDALPYPVFQDGMKSNLDWEAWERISHLSGEFLYDPRILMYHRIHEGSETSALIKDNTRTAEDREMLRRFWPAPIAWALNLAHGLGRKSNG